MYHLVRRLVPLVVVLSAACAPTPSIDQPSVERIIRTLAADEMEGRLSFTPGADRAAEFVRAEFAAIGLRPLGDDDDHLQTFPVYSVVLESIEVELNGLPIPAARLAASLAAESIEWDQDSGIEVIVVGPDDEAMPAFRALRRPGNRLLLMSRSHEALFTRLRGFLARPTRSLEPAGASNAVIVLTDDAGVERLSVRASAVSEAEEIANVVGVLPGNRADEYVVFSAHYDHIGVIESSEDDKIANGANDDASGTTAVIELARYFAAGRRPERTLVFVAFVAEEMGGYGSRYFATQLDPEQIVAMVNIEMIGKVGIRGPGSAWITGFERSDFGPILQGAVEGTEYHFYADPYPDQNLFYRSDNATLARLGVPAHSISTTPIDVDPDYHQVSDEVETLDLEHLTNTIRAIALGAWPIVAGTATPSRIDPVTVE